MSATGKLRVGVLGATGLVGQRLVASLEDHPWFELAEVAASDRGVGIPYGEVVRWHQPGPVPPVAAGLPLLPCDARAFTAQMVFSALDAPVAREVEPAFRSSGCIVVSNASAHRQDPEVPLVIPEVNPDHLFLVGMQQARYGGAILANPNCSTIGLCLALEPLRRARTLRAVSVTTLQALSGAGYPGVPSLDLLDNVCPHIPGEEEKLEAEPCKIFGERVGAEIAPDPLRLSAQCNRVAVREGHLLSISCSSDAELSAADAAGFIRAYRSPLDGMGLPSAPVRPVLLRDEVDRPQPLRDRDAEGGMAISVGGLRVTPAGDLRFVALVHNTVRGASGGTLLIAELLVALGYLSGKG